MAMKETKSQKNMVVALCLLLVAANLAVFAPVKDHDFITYDDYEYIVENPHVRTGLSRHNVRWALTSLYAGNWHPLTWISHMLDCHLYGLNPGGHHWNSLVLHAGNTLLLFLLLRKATGALWRSLLVAALFALHPLHVESVVWASERKDVLSTFFFLASLLAYTSYAGRPGPSRYMLTLALFALGLTAKPMLVTLPFLLLLLDYWPLQRFVPGRPGDTNSRGLICLLLEKTPFFLLSAASSVVTLAAQTGWGAVMDDIPLSQRLTNALYAYGVYLQKTFWPHPLAFYYPHPLGSIPLPWIAGLLLLLVLLTVLSLRLSSRLPYFTVGWLWYLGTLVPVIGLIQVGAHSMANRYTYIPLVGIFLILSWGTAQIASLGSRLKSLTVFFWMCAIPCLIIVTESEVRRWKDSVTLYEHALRVTERNLVAHNNLGNVLARQGKLEEAEHHLREALKLNPQYALAHNNLANVLVKRGKILEGIRHYEEALHWRPDFPQARHNLERAREMER